MSSRVDLAFPNDTGFVFIHGTYIRQGREIVGRFTRDELELCLLIADVWNEDREIVQERMI